MLPAQPSVAERAQWAVSLYMVHVEYGKEADARDRRAGIRRYKNAPIVRLRADLQPVLKAYPDGTVQHSAAAYVLARYGVDTERNVERMYSSARMGQGTVYANQEALPQALADLYVLHRSRAALHHLLTMPSDGDVAEGQSVELVRALRATPDTVLRAAARDPKAWERLAFGAVDGLPSGRGIHEKALFAKLRRDAKKYE